MEVWVGEWMTGCIGAQIMEWIMIFFFFFRWPGRRELLTAMAGCVSGWVLKRLEALLNGWMDAWVDRWMDA